MGQHIFLKWLELLFLLLLLCVLHRTIYFQEMEHFVFANAKLLMTKLEVCVCQEP